MCNVFLCDCESDINYADEKKTKKTITWWGQPSETLIFIRVLLGVELITNYKNNCYKNNNKNNNSCYFIFLDYQIILFNTVFKSLLILAHILGPRNDILFCPKTVFRRDISNAICDHLWSIKRRCEYFVEIGWCQLIPRFRDCRCHTKFHSEFCREPVNFSKVYGRDLRAWGRSKQYRIHLFWVIWKLF